ncbi:hypothetical protein H3H37_22545 [Duganella sp. LX20W]|uniref:Uncharacterized protein n=1 Tax=Rugamonas brunnea TaxID=2758569 RepID=A0A7W2EWD5_9BURK|nr:hypothetical protein [Rugamonas brunnea]MBA5639842.1 hypothetical protein [Rugamonas brunnea]
MSEQLCARFMLEKTSFGGNARKKIALARAHDDTGPATVAPAPQPAISQFFCFVSKKCIGIIQQC